MSVYIFAGRFQPFHNGHMQVFEQICKEMTPTDTLVIGVVSPFKSEDVKDEAFLEASEEHHLPTRNPWDVLVPLSAVTKVVQSCDRRDQIVTTLLPRPEYGWDTIASWFPEKRVWVIPDAEGNFKEEFDDRKSDFFKKMGDKVIRVPDSAGISGRELRAFYKNGQYEDFASFVPEGLANIYFKEKSTETAENDFQKRAEKFEEHSRWVTDVDINNVPRAFLQDKHIGDLLDAGGGTGYLSWYLYQHLNNKINTISLVDISRNMLDEAKLKKNYPVKTHNTSVETFCQMTTRKFDTILMRQVLHYVDDVNGTISLLKKVLNDNGIMYVGQILVDDKECRDWHDELMHNISENRRRTFILEEFKNLFKNNGFEIAHCELTDFEENLTDLSKRRVKENAMNFDALKSEMEALVTDSLKEKMRIRSDDNNLYFTVKFCHLFLKKKENNGEDL